MFLQTLYEIVLLFSPLRSTYSSVIFIIIHSLLYCKQYIPSFMFFYIQCALKVNIHVFFVFSIFFHMEVDIILSTSQNKIMTTSSAGGFRCGYKPVVLASSKEPLKIRHAHSYHRQALKGFSLCLVYWLTHKWVYVLFQ